ncbi:Cof-type HAD-IIB family hydrolase [Paenibacillus aurantius]|uniref:Cof-type HAD-IIB family hydrolase n=1 Tax=Paenibacillus aurantius TaxID=2918900 RepID=A0AA96LBX5_9BACL|nr:Cof-type HAD-IIB family hydrolase [Paenibacillus aurantius]
MVMVRPFRLIALDLDGTLLTDEKTVSAATKLCLQEAVAQGVHVIFATGRGIQTAGAFWQELGLQSPMVLLNGAEIWAGPGALHRRTFLPKETIRRLHEAAVSYGARFWGYSVESLTGTKDWSEEMFGRDWMKFGIKHEDPFTLSALKEQILAWGALHVTSSAPVNLEISVEGITKESGVREVCRLLGIRMEEVLAVGDSDNDLLLLTSAGLGVAMGNAEVHVQKAAGYITASNNEDGVARAIERFVLSA